MERFGFVVLGTDDLDNAVRYWEQIGNLTVTEGRADEVFLSGGAEHHWVRLVRTGERGMVRLGYQLARGADRQELAQALVSSGAEIVVGGSLGDDRVEGTLRFRDPDGIEVELYEEQVTLPRPVAGRYISLTSPLHAVCLVRDPLASVEFYRATLGFAVTDWIERSAAFMRCANGYHHSFGAFENDERPGRLDHLCILVPRVDDVVIARNLAIAAGIERRQDLVRHAASGSISTYIRDEHADTWLEFCTEHEVVEEGRAQRTLPRSATTGDVWEVESLRRGESLEVALGVERLWR